MNTDIAIIGAGTAGCFLAHQLNKAGVDCVLVEKSRGLGGRCSRRFVGGDCSIDMGTGAFSITDTIHHAKQERLTDYINSWLETGTLIPWHHKHASFNDEHNSTMCQSFCAAPSMNAWHKTMASGVKVLSSTRVHKLEKAGGIWQLYDDNHQLIGTANRVVITSPQEQACDLFSPLNLFIDDIKDHTNLPQYVCAIDLAPQHQAELDISVYQGGHAILDAATLENHKPLHAMPDALNQVWLLHSTHQWAEENQLLSHQEAALDLAKAFCQHFNMNDKAKVLTSHYWRLSRHHIKTDSNFGTQLGTVCSLWHDEQQIGCCADWLSTGDIQGALTSALDLFDQLTNNSERTFP